MGLAVMTSPSPEDRAKALVETLNNSTFCDNDDFARKAARLIASCIREAIEAERAACEDIAQRLWIGGGSEDCNRIRNLIKARSRSEKP